MPLTPGVAVAGVGVAADTAGVVVVDDPVFEAAAWTGAEGEYLRFFCAGFEDNLDEAELEEEDEEEDEDEDDDEESESEPESELELELDESESEDDE